jgi:hypothetical protein
MLMVSRPSVRAACSIAVACASLGAAAFVLVSGGEPRLAAASNNGRIDQDHDGLTDLQELVIGTLPYRADSDGDGYSDLEERARGSDPRNAAAVPGDEPFNLGTCASQENGFISALSVVYLKNAALDSVRLEVGVVYNGRVLRFVPASFPYSRGLIRSGRDANDTLAVIEVGIPEDLLPRLGHLNLFSVLRGRGANAPDPVVSLLPLADFSGVAMAIEPRLTAVTNNGGSPTGVVYRPLAGDDRIPSTWNGGEICFQRTSAVGMDGASIVHEVDSSDCLPMDTYCSPADCAAGVGQNLELPDPAALAGG